MKYGYLVLFGCLGLFSRYFLSKFFYFQNPYLTPTLFINLAGCFFIGFLYKLPFENYQQLKLPMMIGFCGCLTTFSSFILEVLKMIELKQFVSMIFYIFISVGIGLLVTYFGMKSTSLFS